MHGPPPENLTLALEALPLFPLAGTVFFPHTLLPLHVFEPRYRQMTQAVLDSHLHMAVVLVDAQRSQPVARCSRIAGLGRVVHHEKLADGRFHILLQGVGRAELLAELPMGDLLYRRAHARLIAPQARDDEPAVQREMASLRSCYARLSQAMPASKDALGDLPMRVNLADVVSDVVCAAAIEDVAARQCALEELDVCARLEAANDAIATLLLRTLPDQGEMH